VLVVGRGDTIVWRKAYGNRATAPRREAMTLDTMFDVASLTKVVATTPAIMQLVEEGRVRLIDPVASFIPEEPHQRARLDDAHVRAPAGRRSRRPVDRL
jgi:CubicO group peptidase (beta-lactamase class C family)